jgi:hypothetical protein
MNRIACGFSLKGRIPLAGDLGHDLFGQDRYGGVMQRFIPVSFGLSRRFTAIPLLEQKRIKLKQFESEYFQVFRNSF